MTEKNVTDRYIFYHLSIYISVLNQTGPPWCDSGRAVRDISEDVLEPAFNPVMYTSTNKGVEIKTSRQVLGD